MSATRRKNNGKERFLHQLPNQNQPFSNPPPYIPPERPNTLSLQDYNARKGRSQSANSRGGRSRSVNRDQNGRPQYPGGNNQSNNWGYNHQDNRNRNFYQGRQPNPHPNGNPNQGGNANRNGNLNQKENYPQGSSQGGRSRFDAHEHMASLPGPNPPIHRPRSSSRPIRPEVRPPNTVVMRLCRWV